MLSRTYMQLILFSSFIFQVYCGSYWGELKIKKIGGNRIMEYCETENGMLLFKGSKVKFRDCFVCTCDENGLSCKTSYGLTLFGYSSCTTVIDDCKPLLVDKRNPKLRCYSGIPTNKEVPKGPYREVVVNSIFG